MIDKMNPLAGSKAMKTMIIIGALIVLCSKCALSAEAIEYRESFNDLENNLELESKHKEDFFSIFRFFREYFAIKTQLDQVQESNNKLSKDIEATEAKYRETKEENEVLEKKYMAALKANVETKNPLQAIMEELYSSKDSTAIAEAIYENYKMNEMLIPPNVTAILYHKLYTFADKQESFKLCDRLTLLYKIKAFMESDLYLYVDYPSKDNLDLLISNLPQSIQGIVWQRKLGITDQTGRFAVSLGELLEHGRIDINLEEFSTPHWIFVPENQECKFRIRHDSDKGHQFYAAYDEVRYNEEQRRVFGWFDSTLDDDAIWELKDFDWRSDSYILHNVAYDGNLNFDINDGRVYTSIGGKQDTNKVIKLLQH